MIKRNLNQIILIYSLNNFREFYCNAQILGDLDIANYQIM